MKVRPCQKNQVRVRKCLLKMLAGSIIMTGKVFGYAKRDSWNWRITVELGGRFEQKLRLLEIHLSQRTDSLKILHLRGARLQFGELGQVSPCGTEVPTAS